ncbi:uncharacterized protein LOC124414854 isoform X2 [Diprion similis]|uniref:uncharacterized protein LOC124414854 isoform X2 n=1 Tax=Diprion similis TaxID=362088 RepID=UPI001EF8BAE4|nr:uncharacterized protein LOC124414854 isoform X2 [Diprion similis]
MTSENGVVLLLHHGDAENLCQPCMKRHQPETYGSPSNRDNACVGEKCRKPVAGLRDRVSGPRRSSGLRPESCDIHFRSRDGNRREWYSKEECCDS